MGFDRNWTEKEQKLMDSWFDDMEFSIDRVLEACGKSSGISNPGYLKLCQQGSSELARAGGRA